MPNTVFENASQVKKHLGSYKHMIESVKRHRSPWSGELHFEVTIKGQIGTHIDANHKISPIFKEGEVPEGIDKFQELIAGTNAHI